MGPEFLSAEEVCTLHLARPNPVGGDGTGTRGSTFLCVDGGRGGAGKVGGCSTGSAPAPCGLCACAVQLRAPAHHTRTFPGVASAFGTCGGVF